MKRGGKTFEKSINLAFQSGGTHGAFTWGVLDRLLEDGRIYIEAISGTSAGAMNAIVVADGLMRAGEDDAREALKWFWTWVGTWTGDAVRIMHRRHGSLEGDWGDYRGWCCKDREAARGPSTSHPLLPICYLKKIGGFGEP